MVGKVPQLSPLERIPHVERYFETYGNAVIADWLSDQIRNLAPATPVVVSGCRKTEEVLAVRAHLPSAKVVAIHASLADRFRWLTARGRPDAPKSMEELFRLTAWEFNLGLAAISYRASLVAINDDSLDSLWQFVLKVAHSDE